MQSKASDFTNSTASNCPSTAYRNSPIFFPSTPKNIPTRSSRNGNFLAGFILRNSPQFQKRIEEHWTVCQFGITRRIKPYFLGLFALACHVLIGRRQGQHMTSTAAHQPMREPHEHFVILQLAEMRERENRRRKTLEEHSEVDASSRSRILSTELWQLRQCADRLDQMIDTMTAAPELVV